MKVQTILDNIDLGSIALPEFQRGYVWNRNQVKDLMDSLYRRHPVGGLLVWETRTEQADARGPGTEGHFSFTGGGLFSYGSSANMYTPPHPSVRNRFCNSRLSDPYSQTGSTPRLSGIQ